MKVNVIFHWIMFLICAIPATVMAQDASNIIPKQSAVKDTSRQTDLIDIAKNLFNINPKEPRIQREKKIYFSILPVPGTVPGGAGKALITSTTAGTYLGPQSTTNLSSATFAPYWNLKSRFGLPLRSSIWLKDNTWNIQGDVRFLVYPQFTWGLGSKNASSDKTLVDYNYIRFYQSALKQIK